MATTDSNGIVFLEETDPISPFHTTINTLQQGTSDAISAARPWVGSLAGSRINDPVFIVGNESLTTNANGAVTLNLSSRVSAVQFFDVTAVGGTYAVEARITNATPATFSFELRRHDGSLLASTTINARILVIGNPV